MKLSRREKVLNQVILAVFAVFALTPLIGVLLSSVTPAKENSGGFAIPSHVDVGNYAQAWTRGNFGTYLLSSVIVTACVVALTVVLAIFAGFAFARMQFVGSSVMFYVLLLGLTLPAEAFVIPLYFNLRSAGLTDTYWALILPQTAQSLAFAVFWMRNQFRGFPGEIIEAARLDGARDIRVLWQIVVPPSVAPIVTMAVLVAMWTWNEFLLPLIMVVSDDLKTAPLGLAFFQGQHLTEYSLLGAAGVMVAAPIAVLYLALQKRFINGVVGGIPTR
jgi:raffinose/stachyose/melibiose transport system permease protein